MSEHAKAALDNPAIQDYFSTAERQLIDAWVACEDPTDAERLRLGVGVIRKMRQALENGVAAGAFAKQMLERMEKEDQAR